MVLMEAQLKLVGKVKVVIEADVLFGVVLTGREQVRKLDLESIFREHSSACSTVMCKTTAA